MKTVLNKTLFKVHSNKQIGDWTITVVGNSDGSLNLLHSIWLGNGYEGTMVRHGDTGYEDGKRSKSLMKKKDFQDDEFEIIDVIEGKPVIKENVTYKVAIYVCVTNEVKEFNCTSPGTMQDKDAAWNNREKAIGKMLTIKFFNYTPDNIPYLPVALQIKEYV